MEYKTKQEEFWASNEWGTAYRERNSYDKVKDNINFFSKIIDRTHKVNSIIEFGPNIGLNLIALHHLLPKAQYAAIEINKEACSELNKLEFIDEVYHESIFEFSNTQTWSLSFIKGVLIHINPDFLDSVYEKLYESSSKYILIAEYYNPSPVTISYRGHEDKLFKRDFAGELMDKYEDLELLDYGFSYHRDKNFPQDDITWFLMEKAS